MNKLFSELESTKCFTNLNAYNKIYSLILDCFSFLDNCNSDNKSVCDLISNTKQNCIDLLNNLANIFKLNLKIFFVNFKDLLYLLKL